MKMYYTEDEKSLLTEDEFKNIFQFKLIRTDKINKTSEEKLLFISEISTFYTKNKSYNINLKNGGHKINISNKELFEKIKERKLIYDIFISSKFGKSYDEGSIKMQNKTVIL